MSIYYVYAYVRKSDGTPYYIGKGKGKRAIEKHPGISVPKDRSKIIFVEQNLTNLGAQAIERRLIRWYGRKDLNTGILLNRTEGGDGGMGGSKPGRVITAEWRAKLREAGKGRKHTAKTKEKMSASKKEHWNSKSVEQRRKILESAIKASIESRKLAPTRKLTEEQKQHLSNINSTPIYCISNDTWYNSTREASKSLFVTMQGIQACLSGIQKSTRGLKFSRKKHVDQS